MARSRPRIKVGRGVPGADEYGWKSEHIIVAEKALGKFLPKGAEIHHINGDRMDNSANNLVICQDRAYHMLLHRRTEALKICGHADWRKCKICKKYDHPDNLYICENIKYGATVYHRKCHASNERRLSHARNHREANC